MARTPARGDRGAALSARPGCRPSSRRSQLPRDHSAALVAKECAFFGVWGGVGGNEGANQDVGLIPNPHFKMCEKARTHVRRDTDMLWQNYTV
eukprot:364570-Chlamydomonas_euryale.AAC.8